MDGVKMPGLMCNIFCQRDWATESAQTSRSTIIVSVSVREF